MEERCVGCGEVVPEGQQVCPRCDAVSVDPLCEKALNWVKQNMKKKSLFEKKYVAMKVTHRKPVADLIFGDCPVCGETELDSEMRYCHRCGQKLDWGGLE